MDTFMPLLAIAGAVVIGSIVFNFIISPVNDISNGINGDFILADGIMGILMDLVLRYLINFGLVSTIFLLSELLQFIADKSI